MIGFATITFFVLVIAILLIPNLVWFITWIASKCFHFRLSYTPFFWTGLGMVVLLVGTLAYGFLFGRYRLDVNRVEYANAMLPEAFDGYRIVHISDLHLDSFGGDTEAVERVVDSINALKPDLVCFTGDIVTISPDAITPYIPVLSRIDAADGVVSVLGNHDFFIYSREIDEWRNAATDSVVAIERSMGWRVLRNENITIHRGADSLTVIGVDNLNMGGQGFQTIQMGDLHKAMEGTDGFRILLSHDPTHWRGQVITESDIPLTLSGHTHSAQMKIFGWTPASLMFPDAAGFSIEGTQTLYVNSGIGCTLPFRLGAPQEITLITLKNDEGYCEVY